MESVIEKRTLERTRGRFFVTLLLLAMPVIAVPLRSGAQAAPQPQIGEEKRPSVQDVPSAVMKKSRRLFLRDCAPCHGKNGDGNSPVRRTLHPTPLDLTGFDLMDSFILHVLHEGVPGSDMPAWHSSPEDDLRAVSAYTVRLGRPDELADDERYAPSGALQEAGRRIYTAHCARCHGNSGNGDGKDATRYPPIPPSFRGMRPSYAMARRVIESGVPGTAMPSWPLLTPQEIQAVTYYIRSLYAGASGATGATRGTVR